MVDTEVKYDNVLVAIMDTAQFSDYWPASLLPMPYIQAALWHAFDYRPVTLRFVTDRTISPPANNTDHVRMPSRGVDSVTRQEHMEEIYVYDKGGEDNAVVWYRCGYGDPMWMVIQARAR